MAYLNGAERTPTKVLKSNPRNARTHSKRQIEQIAASIKEFGFINPILVDEKMNVLAGHGRLRAAELLGRKDVPILRIEHLSDAQKRAYVIADNQIALKAGWDFEILAFELEALGELDFEVELTGFELAEIDMVIAAAADAEPDGPGPEDQLHEPESGKNVSRPGDTWQLGRHRLICGDARCNTVLDTLLADERADMIFTDPPYNVPIGGHVSGLGKNTHREFAMASGEMTQAAFTEFLVATLSPAAERTKNGGISYVCMDWRHMGELIEAGGSVFDELKNVCVWAKTNAGMGTFYRSQHELVFVFKSGTKPHTNTFELGQTGRHRSNLWTYAGANAFGAGRDAELAMHPTVKPVGLVEDAILDVTCRNEIVLDPFGGSGSTLIAAEKCGRRARLVEIDPIYCDVIVRRWQTYTGKTATLVGADAAFDEVCNERANVMAEETS